jgi:hypothetical protein
MGTLIRNVLNLNDIDAVDVVSTAAADTTLLIDDFNHGQSNLIWEFVRCAKTTVCFTFTVPLYPEAICSLRTSQILRNNPVTNFPRLRAVAPTRGNPISIPSSRYSH